MNTFLLALLFWATVALGNGQTSRGLTVDSHDITVLLNTNESFIVFAKEDLTEPVSVRLLKEHDDHLSLDPESFTYPAGATGNQTVVITGLRAGYVAVTAVDGSNELIEDVYLRVTVAVSKGLIYTSIVFGWVYFVAWSVSFYPQIWINFRRKSVEGLNFDFVILNIVGFTLYSMFNCGLYFFDTMQDEYESRHPRGLNPVMLNDVVFSLHAMFATIITIVQCCIYERAGQRVSWTAYSLLSVFGVVVVVSASLAAASVIHWLDFLYYCSYVKLAITIIKYVPQALMNYRRKSTAGWSIGNILLDFTGGTLSMLQMILNGFNYDDWASIFGDPTKFGLGLFSVLFDVFFMLQHYVFYRTNPSYGRVTRRVSVYALRPVGFIMRKLCQRPKRFHY
ncbi:cystinosin homolog isoform X1 [Drosophila pseudoobscura]|uniref:Cystinosin homolog isoform X1 n=1 Tax=Drosophila pseudoobscura pseudoobscura TaxID=46245 RepID=A0A6I8VN76_DROPS|nr:cystinosin homolog isoform X1 [Drosophila pseudoobscura]XP_033232458.1 cystinosin homolog isoform X1 [Drosophila pseudoobscura]XP_033232477.1 cystinosin homolog isoform X1 [Drosophila pseudoobscura]